MGLVHDTYGKSVLRCAFAGEFNAYPSPVPFDGADANAGTSRIDGTIGDDIAVEVESRASKQVRGALVDLAFHPHAKKLLLIIRKYGNDYTAPQCRAILKRLCPTAPCEVVEIDGNGKDSEKYLSADVEAVRAAVKRLRMSMMLTPEEKGRRFEEFVVRRIAPLTRENGHVMTFTEWRGDKHVEGLDAYAHSNSRPDLEFERECDHYRFAFECKWRARWLDPLHEEEQMHVRWVSEEWKRKMYVRYAEQPNLLCHVVLGIGWNEAESRPCETYLVPILTLSDRIITKSHAMGYACNDLVGAVRTLFQEHGLPMRSRRLT